MKRRRGDAPGPAPFIDKWGRPVWSNPFGQNRRNPELDLKPPIAAWPPGPGTPVPVEPEQVRVQGWQEHERHFDPAANVAPPALESPAPVDSVATADATSARTRAERLAEQVTVRRARTRRRVRRGGSIAAAGLAVFGVTAAYGFWTGGADAGSRTPALLPVAAEATAGMASSPLVPTGNGNVKLQVDNPNGFAVTLFHVSGGPFPSNVSGAPGCTIANSAVTFVPPEALNVNIPAHSTTLVRLVGAASMGRGSAPACKGHTFTFPVSVQVRKP